MTIKTVARGSYSVVEDISRNPTMVEFSDRTVGQDIPLDGDDFCYFTFNDTGVETYKWAERDGVVVARYDVDNITQYGGYLITSGHLAPGVPALANRTTFRLYLVGLRFLAFQYTSNKTDLIEINSTTDPATQSLKMTDWGSNNIEVLKNLSGWVTLVIESDRPNGVIRAKAWQDADDEPEGWDGTYTSDAYVGSKAYFFPRYVFRTLTATADCELASIKWEAIE